MKMGFKAALVAALLCISAPAYAGISIIAGTDTGGALGHNSSSGSLTVIVTTTVDAPPGSLIVAMPTAAASLSWTGCTDSAGNTYSAAFTNTLNSTFTERQFYTIATNDLPNGGTITCTANSSSGAKTMVAVAFSGAAASPLDAAGVAQTGSSTTFTTGPTGTLAYPGGSNGEVLVGFIVTGSTSTMLNDASFVDLGIFFTAGGTQARSIYGYKIVSASTAITYAPTGSASGLYAGELGAYEATSGAVTLGRRALLGVGN